MEDFSAADGGALDELGACAPTGRWIAIRGWDRFQHRDVLRGEGVPPWIKVYTRLHHNDAWMTLSGHRRAILLGLWIEYAQSRKDLAENTAELSRKLALRVTTRDLEALNHAGFIDFLPAPCKPRVDIEKPEELTFAPADDDIPF
jgi:hypothetical protein